MDSVDSAPSHEKRKSSTDGVPEDVEKARMRSSSDGLGRLRAGQFCLSYLPLTSLLTP